MRFKSIATLTGTIIGAGILALPYSIHKVGLVFGIILTSIVLVLMSYLHLALAEVTLRTKEKHQLTGYAEKYLGRKGKIISFLSMIFGIYGAIVAYLVAQSYSLSEILQSTLNISLSPVYFTFPLIFTVSLILWYNIKGVEISESVVQLIVYSVLIGIPVYLLTTHNISFSNLYVDPDIQDMIYVTGTLFFAFLGTAAIPELREELDGEEKEMFSSILTGMAIVFLLYVIFYSSFLLTLSNIPTIATEVIPLVGNFITILITFPPFISLSFALKEMFMYDFGLEPVKSQLLVLIPPLILSLVALSYSNFSDIVSVVGSISMIFTGNLIVSMLYESKRRSERNPEFTIPINKPIKILLHIILTILPLIELL